MTTTLDDVPCLLAQSAAESLGTTTMKILILLKEGILKGSERDGAWYVTQASLERYRSEGAEHKPSCRTNCGTSKCGCH